MWVVWVAVAVVLVGLAALTGLALGLYRRARSLLRALADLADSTQLPAETSERGRGTNALR